MLRMFQPSSTEFWQLETSKLETPEQDSSGTVPVRFFARTSAFSAPQRETKNDGLDDNEQALSHNWNLWASPLSFDSKGQI